MTGMDMACGSSRVRFRSSSSVTMISAASLGLTSNTGESCWLISWVGGWHLETSSLLAVNGGIKSTSQDGPSASDLRDIPAWPPMLPPASKGAGCVGIPGCLIPQMLPTRPDSKEGMRTGVIMSTPLVLESGL